ncbi:hypothetical protein CRUP_001873 [Coryphaenoides rupestris]|nr:hypothetical protein CRUP_001873 [Coryphaenoides rupestris]
MAPLLTTASLLLLLLLRVVVAAAAGREEEVCRGAHCRHHHHHHHAAAAAQDWRSSSSSGSSGSSRGRGIYYPGYQQQVDAQTTTTTRSHRQAQHSPQRAAGFTYAAAAAAADGANGARRTNPRTVTAEVYHPHCAGGRCHGGGHGGGGGGVSVSSSSGRTHHAQCNGVECKLPLGVARLQKATHAGTGTGTAAAAHAGRASSGPSPLTCDMKPGTNEVPEDALVLQLRLSKGQETLIEALRAQQAEVRELQRLLTDQQGTLVSQQRDILEQQRRMYEQMDQVKAQYGVLLENVKTWSLQDLQGELDTHMETLRRRGGGGGGGGGRGGERGGERGRGGGGRDEEQQVDARHHHHHQHHHTQQAFAVHKVDMEAMVMEVGRPVLACRTCGPEEYCGFSTGQPGCERCTVCPAGFFMVAQCTVHADRICQDRDECLEVTHQCGDSQQCLNTPGGFRCQGMTERDANSGMCGHSYFFNIDMDECQACSECEGDPVVAACTFTTDTVCSTSPAGDASMPLSLSWAGEVDLPPASRGHALGDRPPGVPLRIRGREDGELASAEDGRLVLTQHGLVWLDENLSLSHGCRSFVQVCLRLNTTAGGGGGDGSEEGGGGDLSGVRVEQREGRALQSASISGVAVVAPGYVLSLSLKSATQHCNQSDGLQLYDPPGASLSLLWLSHDTGAVAMTAQAVASAHYHTNYRPVFKTTFASDPYVLGLSHDGRGVRFAESGTVRFVFQQALYSMGQACVNEGFHLLAYLNRNGTSVELSRTFKPGVHYRDTSVSLSGAARVDHGDMLAFEVLCPAQCNVRYFGDGTAISILSLVWVPAAISSSLTAAVTQAGLPSGAVRNKPLFFQQTSPAVPQVTMAAKGPREQKRDFVFRESGTASVALDLKLIHSCSLLKVGGQMPEGSQWAAVALRASFQVRNGTAVSFTLDCVRGRVNQISHQAGSGVSILWVAA